MNFEFHLLIDIILMRILKSNLFILCKPQCAVCVASSSELSLFFYCVFLLNLTKEKFKLNHFLT